MEELDLRVQRTYKLLIEAFEDLLREKEFEKISVKELCDTAMIRRPTFYKHFLDKYDFLTFFIKHKMNLIFDHAFQNLEDEEEDFFVLVFEQLLDQFDNLVYLLFRLQMNADIIVELESVQEYGQRMLRNHINTSDDNDNLSLINEYKGQIIMNLTIQSVYWYKNNKDKISREEIIDLYKQTLEKLWE
ncbi:transcriptional regulator, TetR family [Atopostipes suicloacalis DSM 15692]|uniref:Transcriptional regulator, TetR family n=1 Tax=Atopostipes suicloacalis DSM 15692 TaxID=1121025 RepID=A0A1M4UD85_9LACT|nr:TetR/AcrR family transcriptional regulator [Atopostipes suicloacalis]SHE54685.1 transcriptional regulator, TetR family [Atopostipes suicloacalis DSM 15692]